MTDKTKLLKMIENALQTAPPDEEAEAQAVIDDTADWFEHLTGGEDHYVEPRDFEDT